MCVGEVARGLGCDRRSFPVGPSSSPPDSQGPRNGLFPTERARAADWPRVFALIQHVLRNTCSMWELGYSGAQARHVPWSPLTFSILSPPPRPSQQPELSLAHVAGPARSCLLCGRRPRTQRASLRARRGFALTQRLRQRWALESQGPLPGSRQLPPSPTAAPQLQGRVVSLPNAPLWALEAQWVLEGVCLPDLGWAGLPPAPGVWPFLERPAQKAPSTGLPMGRVPREAVGAGLAPDPAPASCSAWTPSAVPA